MRSSSSSSSLEVVRITIIGAGSSSSTPLLRCVAQRNTTCACLEAASRPASRNHRLNPSLLIQLAEKGSPPPPSRGPGSSSLSPVHRATPSSSVGGVENTNSRIYNVLIDCGKTFREASLRHFHALGVTSLDAVLLTHDHADACFGLDDLREFSDRARPIKIYCDARTMKSMGRVFSYLFPITAKKAKTWTANIDWIPFNHGEKIPVTVLSTSPTNNERVFPIQSFPLVHGRGYISNGFLIPLSDSSVLAYFSDLSEYPEEKHQELLQALQGRIITIAIIDFMSFNAHSSHLHYEASIDVAKRIRAAHTYFVGMSHSVEYYSTSARLQQAVAESGLQHVELGWDGCIVFQRDELSSRENQTNTARSPGMLMKSNL